MMKTMRKPISWCAVFVCWALGGLLLLKIWTYQKSLPDPLGSYIEFSIMFLITFYVLALLPIKHSVDWFLFRCGLFADTNRNSA
ncbi:exported hypothetical protein [Syntrophobacter sp. SbD1]|nr:exported hypothetical protein [Syntrophobacter sp. SbD1]